MLPMAVCMPCNPDEACYCRPDSAAELQICSIQYGSMVIARVYC